MFSKYDSSPCGMTGNACTIVREEVVGGFNLGKWGFIISLISELIEIDASAFLDYLDKIIRGDVNLLAWADSNYVEPIKQVREKIAFMRFHRSELHNPPTDVAVEDSGNLIDYEIVKSAVAAFLDKDHEKLFSISLLSKTKSFGDDRIQTITVHRYGITEHELMAIATAAMGYFDKRRASHESYRRDCTDEFGFIS